LSRVSPVQYSPRRQSRWVLEDNGINGGELRGQPSNPGSSGKMAVKTVCVYGTTDLSSLCRNLLFKMKLKVSALAIALLI